MIEKRITTLLEEMKRHRIQTMLITNLTNIRYLSGFTGSNAFLIISPNSSLLITDSRYTEQASIEVKGFEIITYRKSLEERIANYLSQYRRVAFEKSITYELHEKISKALPDKTRFEPSPPLIEEMRATKDKTEIARIRKSVEIARKSYKACIPKIRAGIEERELAMEIEFLMRKEGAEESAFDTICASGKNSSLPHAKAGRRKIIEGDTVIIDFGAKFKGYNSDITRTLILGKPKKEVEEIFKLLKSVLTETIKGARPGICASDLDGIARTKIEREGYGSYFLHGLGHGIGLDVHEKPNISATSKDKINPGMVFTIEPGIYIEGKFGIRIEEMLLMRESTPLLLTKGF